MVFESYLLHVQPPASIDNTTTARLHSFLFRQVLRDIIPEKNCEY